MENQEISRELQEFRIARTALIKEVEKYTAAKKNNENEDALHDLEENINSAIYTCRVTARRAKISVVPAISACPRDLIEKFLENAEFEDEDSEINLYKKVLNYIDTGKLAQPASNSNNKKPDKDSDALSGDGLAQALGLDTKVLPNDLSKLSLNKIKELLDEAVDNQDLDSVKLLEEELARRKQKAQEKNQFQGISQ